MRITSARRINSGHEIYKLKYLKMKKQILFIVFIALIVLASAGDDKYDKKSAELAKKQAKLDKKQAEKLDK